MRHRDLFPWEMQEVLFAIERAYLANGIDEKLLGFAARTLMTELTMERAEAAAENSELMLNGAEPESPTGSWLRQRIAASCNLIGEDFSQIADGASER
jgi:hypothetical protein